ncbi:esterase/lipase family protein [Streptomyces sp. NPDC005955]|uniref:esterase/lipase family protein n=1 Tax=Streptomyces sp. NPDC005955 TaxID=3364738 RepID=UPI0036AA077A
MTEIPVQSWGLFAREGQQAPPPAPEADETWALPGGTARVYYGDQNRALVRPVILSDGFNSGPTDFDAFWHGLENGQLPFVSRLRERGHDLVLLGYDERSASLLANAQTAIACILRTVAERLGDTRLTVGGFSMGGLITRYALAKLETQRMDHQTAAYFSFDSPHRGASIPISLQALAHFLKPVAPALSKQINSPAARQLLWRHIETVHGSPAEDPLRGEFLDELKRVGGWPRIPRLLALANGRLDGVGNGVPAGEPALEVTKGGLKPTTLLTQTPDGKAVLAHLKDLLREEHVRHRGLPELDGAPGGTLDSFGIAADNLTKPLLGMAAVAHHPEICFVPTGSALSVRDISQESLYEDLSGLDPDAFDVDDYIASSETNTRHSALTPELGEWLLDRLPN